MALRSMWARFQLAVGRCLKTEPIYVEIRIRAPMDALWRHTQIPDIHARWDLRFTDIRYLPKEDPDDLQHFRYASRLGPITIAGEGVTVGNQEQPDSRTSALRFSTADPRSIIKHGSGYWRYIQTDDGIRFLTSYSYDPRWGLAGACIDRLFFRQAIGWATAWSFDRLRLWVEDGLDPAISIRLSAIHAVARIGLATIWIYHGLVPKLLYPDAGEADFIPIEGFSERATTRIIQLGGLAEIAAGVGTVALWNRRELFPVTGMALVALACGAIVQQPSVSRAPFSPISLTIGAVGLCAIGYIASREIPSSRRSLRKPLRSTP